MKLLSSAWARAAMLAAPVLLYYGPSVTNDFVWDDRLTATAPTGLSAILVHRTGDYYRPIVMLSFTLDRLLWGSSPIGYHAVNITWHIAAAWLLLTLCRALGLGNGVAMAAALVFACHPVQSDAVLYISGRTDIMCAVFVLLCLHAWRRTRSAADGYALASGAALVAALLCKEAAVLVPLTLLLRQAHPGSRPPRPVVPIACAAVWLAVWSATARHIPGITGCIERLPAIGAAALGYVRLLLWPADLHLERFVAVGGWTPASTALTWMALGVLGCTLALGARRVVAGHFWLALCLVTYLPVSGIVPAYPAIAERALFAPEHFLYLPLLGLAPLATSLIALYWPASLARFAPAALGACLLGWGLVVLDRSRDWRNEETLFRHTLQHDPPVARVWFNLGNLRLRAGAFDEAEGLYRAALLRAPRDAGIHLNLGITLQREGRLREAEQQYEAAVRLDPSHHEARRALAALLLRRGETTRARLLLEHAQGASTDP